LRQGQGGIQGATLDIGTAAGALKTKEAKIEQLVLDANTIFQAEVAFEAAVDTTEYNNSWKMVETDDN
jgi:hypothetical protein